MSRFRRAALRDESGYVPGEQPPPDEEWLKLNTNEAPIPPAPAVAPAIAAAAAELRRYPDPLGEPLRSALAAHHGVAAEQIMVGNGADDVLECCFRAFCGPGGTVVYPVPTYSLLPVLTRLHDGIARELPLDRGAGLPAELGTSAGDLRIVVNPNAPTGVWAAPDRLEALLRPAPGVVVIDEAYCDFAPASFIPAVVDHPGWLAVRTFSKSYALAGLRVGYAVADRELIRDLLAVKDSYPVGRCAIAGALAALADRDHHRRLVVSVVAERDRLTAGLRKLDWTVLPSHANFVFARPASGTGGAVTAGLHDRRILVRHFGGDGPYGEWIRITVGTADQNHRLLAALRDL